MSRQKLRVRIERLDGVDDLLSLPEAERLRDHHAAGPTFYWQHPSGDEAILAIGAARTFKAAGADRMAIVRREALATLGALNVRGSSSDIRPMVVGGFAFRDDTTASPAWQDFPPAWFFLPRSLWVLRKGECHRMTVEGADEEPALPAIRRAPGATRETTREQWTERVETVLAAIAAGDAEKIVLSRERRVANGRPNVLEVVRQGCRRRPDCFTYALQAAGSTLFGSTPELLVRVEGSRFEAPALAGTMKRGRTSADDAVRREALLSCPKNRREHRAVVEGIRHALADLPVEIQVAGRPDVVELPEALHLRTAIRGRSLAPLNPLSLATLLHPTPAVCGTPRATAHKLIRELEAHRGWYTGGIGWMDSAGDGELCVVLRSAIADEHGLFVQAGAGIVDGSEAAAEWAETDLKMTAILDIVRAAGSSNAAADTTPEEDGTALSA